MVRLSSRYHWSDISLNKMIGMYTCLFLEASYLLM